MTKLKRYNNFLEINENLINDQLRQFAKDGIEIKHRKIFDEFSPNNSYDIYWGKNKESNHFLTSNFTGQYAKSIGGVMSSVQDIWLHASGYPGSHVLIKAIKDDIIPEFIKKQAAEIAKNNSKAKDTSGAEIVWCYKNDVSVNPGDKTEQRIKSLESKSDLTEEEEKFIEKNKPTIGRAFIEDKNRNIIII